MAILGCFTVERPMLGIAAIADALGMSRSTTHRYVTTLQALGYLVQDGSRKYRLALSVTTLGMEALNSMAIGEHARPYLEALHQRTSYTTSLAILDGSEIRYIERLVSTRRHRQKSTLAIKRGAALPAQTTALGKLLLANLPDAELASRLREIAPKKCGPNTIMSKSALRAELNFIRHEGLATDDEESEAGLCAIAAPIRNTNDVVAAIDLVAPKATIALPDLLSALGPHLVATADNISARLGWRLKTYPTALDAVNGELLLR